MIDQPTLIAQCMHECNQAAIGQLGGTVIHWEAISDLQKAEYIGLVTGTLANVSIELQHERWRANQLTAGWQYGVTYDESAKTDPRLVPWGDQRPRTLLGRRVPRAWRAWLSG